MNDEKNWSKYAQKAIVNDVDDVKKLASEYNMILFAYADRGLTLTDKDLDQIIKYRNRIVRKENKNKIDMSNEERIKNRLFEIAGKTVQLADFRLIQKKHIEEKDVQEMGVKDYVNSALREQRANYRRLNTYYKAEDGVVSLREEEIELLERIKENKDIEFKDVEVTNYNSPMFSSFHEQCNEKSLPEVGGKYDTLTFKETEEDDK